MGAIPDNAVSAARPRRGRAAAGLALAAALALAAVLAVREYRRQHRFDPLIAEIAAAHNVDAALIRRVVRRESRFRPDAVGTAGEIGLMQVTAGAARDWAESHRVEPPDRAALFDPALNLRVGAWYLARALRHWGDRDDPVVFALAEYNAGRRNAARWAAGAPTAEAFLAAITYPSTRRYILDVTGRSR